MNKNLLARMAFLSAGIAWSAMGKDLLEEIHPVEKITAGRKLAVGCGNPGRTSFGLQIAEAQLAMNDAKQHPEFVGNVKCVESRDFWREVDVSPANQGYHYNRNAETYMEVGNALGWAMAALLKNKK